MKVLFCTNTFNHITHGPAKFANLILEINSLYPEHEIRILTEDVDQESKFIYKLNIKKSKVWILASQFQRMYRYYKAIINIHKIYPFDVVVFNNAYLGLITSKSKKFTTVGMINDYGNLSATIANFDGSYSWVRRFVFKYFERLSVKSLSLIIANSDYLMTLLKNEYLLPSNKLKRLYKAIDLSLIPFKINREFTKPYVHILFVKADFITGGLATLAKALVFLNKYKIKVSIIGPEKKYHSQILSLFKEHANLELAILGVKSPDTVNDYLQSCDIFCVPSIREALGVANIEALASGISVITTNAGGIPEVMDYGNNGWLVNPNQPQELAAAIEDCINNKTKRIEKSLNAKRFIQKFSKEQMFINFLQILKDVNTIENFQSRAHREI